MLTLERMRADIAAMINEDPGEVGDSDNLIDLGLDSIRAMALAAKWREAGADVQFAELAERPELGYWWDLISKRLPPPAPGSPA
jgi:aryl carrier-like protein